MVRKIIVSDICNTLYDSNTTFDFVNYCIRNGFFKRKQRLLYYMCTHKMSPAFWCLAGIHKFFKRDLIKPIAILLFRNRSEDEVQDWAEKFYNNYLSARKIESTNSILLNNHDYDLVLASATIDPVAKVIAGDLKPFCYFATKLERKNGIYTGRIQREISGRKPEVINEFFNGMVSIETAMSDNHSDYNLLHSACKKIAVCYTGKDENFWSKMKGVQIIKILKSE